MAIQTRRGTYNDFDPEKLMPGEWATVQSDDPHSADGKSMYMCFAPGEVKRMATYEDMVQNIDSAVEEIKDQFSAGMQQATDAANTAAGSATEATSAATTAAERANEVAQTIEEAVQGTIINDASPSDLTVYSSQKIESEFRKESEIVDISHGGTGATTAEAARESLGIPLPLSVQNGGTGATTAEEARANLEFGTPIWTGEWRNGSIEISRLQEYSTYKITVIDADTVIIANRKGTALRGVGAYYSTNNVAHIYIMSATVSGNRLTYQNVIDMGFNSSGFRAIQEAAGISGIYGII